MIGVAAIGWAAGYWMGSNQPSPLMRMSYYELQIKDPEQFHRAWAADPRWSRDINAYDKTHADWQETWREYEYEWLKSHHVGGDWF